MRAESHHVLFTRKAWESQDSTRSLRQDEWLIPKMDSDTHKELHQKIGSIPLLDHITGRLVEREYESKSTHLASINGLMSTIDRVKEYDCVPYLECELAQLVIYGIEMQIPFIKDGSVRLFR